MQYLYRYLQSHCIFLFLGSNGTFRLDVGVSNLDISMTAMYARSY